MKKILLFVFAILISTQILQAQEKDVFLLEEVPCQKKNADAVWRTDYYICTGIAYAKSKGYDLDDFIKFVANHHSMAAQGDTSFAKAIRVIYRTMTNYPNGTFKILQQTDSYVKAQWNRPYSIYFVEGRMLNVTIEEFETFLYEHLIIMAKRMNIDFKYEISPDNVTATLTRL